jgi:transaldolase
MPCGPANARAPQTLESGLDDAKRVPEQRSRVGVDYNDMTETLAQEGVQKFADSFQELLNTIEAKRRELVPL